MSEEAEVQLTAEQRRRNVARAKKVESRLGDIEQRLSLGLYYVVGTLRELHGEREELRAVFGLDPLGPMAPLFEDLADAAEKAAPKVETGRKK